LIRYRPGLTFDPRTTPTATLEHLLSGVPALTDTQRDTAEVLEQTLRDTIALRATRIWRARQTETSWWQAERIQHDRDVNAILATRAAVIDRMQQVLTPAQQRRFVRNVDTYRNYDIWLWTRFAATGEISVVPDRLWVLSMWP
jgi:hypothetical protein